MQPFDDLLTSQEYSAISRISQSGSRDHARCSTRGHVILTVAPPGFYTPAVRLTRIFNVCEIAGNKTNEVIKLGVVISLRRWRYFPQLNDSKDIGVLLHVPVYE